MDAITNCEDNTRANYATDYLPAYTELRFELINTYRLAERRRVEMNKRGGRKDTTTSPSWMGTLNLAQGIKSAIDDVGQKGTVPEILPAKGEKERFIMTLRNGSESRARTLKGAADVAAMERAKAKAKES